jgi:nicotinate-nucleotide pyrophosphorylase (carboxylating)
MQDLRAFIRDSLAEDIGQGDVTTDAIVGGNSRCQAWLLAKQDGVVSGIKVFRLVLDLLDADLRRWEALPDGARFSSGFKVAGFQGRTRAVLTGERLALNILQHLSGVATLTAQYVEAVADLPTRICDTRKTTPMMRKLEKDAVVHGGASNHRYALFDGVLIKENHIAAAGGIGEALERARAGTHHLMRLGIEVTSLAELRQAIDGGADAILLDNMDNETMREAVSTVRAEPRRIITEASGNVTLDRVRGIAETGVDLISVGALTHSAPAVDYSLVLQSL